MKLKVFVVVLTTLICLQVDAAQLNLEQKIERSVIEQISLQKNPYEVEITFLWERIKTLWDCNHKNPSRNKKIIVSTFHETTTCKGTLLEGGDKVVTISDCAKDNLFDLKSIDYTLANGKKGHIDVKTGFFQKNSDFFSFEIDSSLSEGLVGAKIGDISPSQLLKDAFGAEIYDALYDWFGKHNISSERRQSKRVITMEKGKAFLWNGHVIALVKKVPRKLPKNASDLERFLTLFRENNH